MKFDVTTEVALERIFDEYLTKKRKREEAESAAAVSSSGSEQRGPEGSGAEESASNVVEVTAIKQGGVKAKPTKCTAKDCKRKGPPDCLHSMCFLCCFETIQQAKSSSSNAPVCIPHLDQFKNRELEDKYIEEALMQLTHKKTRLARCCEERFTAPDQTVVIWCLRDFLLNPKWSGDIIAQETKIARQKELARKRQMARQNSKK